MARANWGATNRAPFEFVVHAGKMKTLVPARIDHGVRLFPQTNHTFLRHKIIQKRNICVAVVVGEEFEESVFGGGGNERDLFGVHIARD